MAKARLALCVLVPLAMLVTAINCGAESDTTQLSPNNNVLHLHYNETRREGWMNTLPNETGDDGWNFYGGIFGHTARIPLSFPMKPRLDPALCLTMDPAVAWRVRVDHFEGRGRIVDVIGALTAGNYSCSTTPGAVQPYEFAFVPGFGMVRPGMDIIFNLSFVAEGGDFVGNDIHILTNGKSNMTLPILATERDSDGDGHNDTVDAYPQDPARWQKPEPRPRPMPGFEALPAVLAIVILAVAFVKRRHPWSSILAL